MICSKSRSKYETNDFFLLACSFCNEFDNVLCMQYMFARKWQKHSESLKTVLLDFPNDTNGSPMEPNDVKENYFYN